MDLINFESTLTGSILPGGVSMALSALWYAGKKEWEQAHNIAQNIETKDGYWVHAYLHRQEGDEGNANYWYNKAGKPMPRYSLEKEWEEIVRAMLVISGTGSDAG
jgi:hypothetical protein